MVEFFGIFAGKRVCKAGLFRDDRGHLWKHVKNKFFPLLSTWVIEIYNAGDLLKNYDSLKMVDNSDNTISSKEVRFYPIDWDTKKINYEKVDTEYKAEVKSLEVDRDYLLNHLNEVTRMLEEQNIKDLYLHNFKTDHNIIATMKTGMNVESKDKGKKSKR